MSKLIMHCADYLTGNELFKVEETQRRWWWLEPKLGKVSERKVLSLRNEFIKGLGAKYGIPRSDIVGLIGDLFQAMIDPRSWVK